ncbi:MAG: hypothetical protein ACYTGG_13305 [Planctomycetota bacterium]|jgi:hypothetical protein
MTIRQSIQEKCPPARAVRGRASVEAKVLDLLAREPRILATFIGGESEGDLGPAMRLVRKIRVEIINPLEGGAAGDVRSSGPGGPGGPSLAPPEAEPGGSPAG